MPTPLHLTVNDRPVDVQIEPRMLLVELLRGRLGLTGTRVGCDTHQCGACTVLVDGQAVKSCSMLATQAQGCTVTTVEGLAQGGQLHPVQEAFLACQALPCGFCAPGMMMTTVCLLSRQPDPSEAEIVQALQGNQCFCNGVRNLVATVQQAARAMAASGAGRA